MSKTVLPLAVLAGCLFAARPAVGQSAFGQLLELSGGQLPAVPDVPEPIPVDPYPEVPPEYEPAPPPPRTQPPPSQPSSEPRPAPSPRTSPAPAAPALLLHVSRPDPFAPPGPSAVPFEAASPENREAQRERYELRRRLAEARVTLYEKEGRIRKIREEPSAERVRADGLRERAAAAGRRLAEALDGYESLRDAPVSAAPSGGEERPGLPLDRVLDRSISRRLDREAERLEALSTKLDERIADLRRWREEGKKEAGRFERIRAEATWDALSNVLSAIPLGSILDARKGLDPARVARAKSALASMKSLVASAESVRAPQDRDRWIAIADSADAAAEALRELATVRLAAHRRREIETIHKAVTATRKLGQHLHECAQGNEPDLSLRETIASTAEASVDIASAWCPAVEVGQAAFGFLEAGFHHVVATGVIDDLRAAEARNWDAERHLLEKKAELEARIRELRRGRIASVEVGRTSGSR